MFVDEVKIFARAGDGGKGCVAFLRETFRPKGGPAGGNGWRGGDVILQADHDLNNLVAQYYQPRLLAQNGDNGMGRGMDGHAGEDLLVKVPCGTMVWRMASAEPADIADEPPDKPATPLRLATGKRPTFRYAGSQRAAQINLQEGADETAKGYSHDKGELVADLT